MFWGDYLITGSTLTIDNAFDFNAATVTVPRMRRGIGHTALICSLTPNAVVSQLVTLSYNGGGWDVFGSSSGAMGSVNGGSCQDPGAGQFSINIAEGPLAVGDRMDFALIAKSGEAGYQKRILFGMTNPLFRESVSQIRVAPDGGLVFLGNEADPILVDRLNSGSTYFSIHSSGSFHATYTRFTNLENRGLILSGDKGVLITSSTFDFIGIGGDTNTYITTNDLTEAATFSGIGFLL